MYECCSYLVIRSRKFHGFKNLRNVRRCSHFETLSTPHVSVVTRGRKTGAVVTQPLPPPLAMSLVGKQRKIFCIMEFSILMMIGVSCHEFYLLSAQEMPSQLERGTQSESRSWYII